MTHIYRIHLGSYRRFQEKQILLYFMSAGYVILYTIRGHLGTMEERHECQETAHVSSVHRSRKYGTKVPQSRSYLHLGYTSFFFFSFSCFIHKIHLKTPRVRGIIVAIPRKASARSRLACVCPSVQAHRAHTELPVCASRAQTMRAHTHSERARFVTIKDTISSRQPFLRL